MAASAVGFALFLAQLRVAGTSRVKVQEHGFLSIPDLETVKEEEALVTGSAPLDPEQFDDHIRLLMRAHSQSPDWNAEVLMDSMVHIIELKRSSPEKRTLTCDQATNFLFLQTKWRIDAQLADALQRGDTDPASALAPLVACSGDASSDSTCTALPTLAAKCPENSVDDLLALRSETFGGYAAANVAGSDVASEPAHSESADAEAADEESVVEEVEGADGETEDEAVEAPAEEVPEAAVEQEAPEQKPVTPNYYEPCKVDRKVHEVHKDKAHKCDRASKAGSCPGSGSTYCYDTNRAARCCCRESDLQIKNKIGGQRVKKGTAKCANVYSIPE